MAVPEVPRGPAQELCTAEGGAELDELESIGGPEGAEELTLPPQAAWDFPLSRAEKVRRLLLIFEAELDHNRQEVQILQSRLPAADQAGSPRAAEPAVRACAETAADEAGAAGAAATTGRPGGSAA